MKSKTIILYVAFIIAMVVSCKPKNSAKEDLLADAAYRLEGFVQGIDDGEIYLIDGMDRDTILVSNGRFIAEGNLEEPSKKYLVLTSQDSISRGIDIFLEAGEMELIVDIDKHKEFTLTGSENQNKFNELNEEMNSLQSDFKSILDNIGKIYQNMANSPSKESLQAMDSLQLYFESKERIIVEFIEKNPSSFVSLDQLSTIASSMQTDQPRRVFSLLSEDLRTSAFGKALDKEIAGIVAGKVGSQAPDFTIIDKKNNNLSLSDFNDKYVLLDFWASWCVPCRKGNPHLIELYNKYKPLGFEIIAIADDIKNINAWNKAIEKDKTDIWINTLRNGENTGTNPGDKEEKDTPDQLDIAAMFGVQSLPTKIILDPEGKVVYRIEGWSKDTEDTLDEKMKEFFTEGD